MTSGELVSWNEEIEEILVDKLPVPVVCLLRCVCKRWSSWPCGGRGGRIERRNLVLSFLDNDRPSTATYSPTLRRWYRLPLYNLRPSIPRLQFWKPRGDVYLVAADGGLLCFMVGFATPQKDVKFIIVNPIANTWRQLPPFPRDQPTKPPLVCGMHVDKMQGTYKLILAGQSLTFNEEEARATHLFDSATGEWKSGGDLPQEIFGIQKQCHFWDGSFYYVDCCANRVQAYDEYKGIWQKVLPIIPSFLCSPTFVECCGSIALVGPIGKSARLEIMTLDPSRREWRRLEILPSEPALEAFLHRLVPGPHHSSLLCVGQEDVIYVLSSKADVAIIYDALQRRWSFVPSIPAPRHNSLEVRVVFTIIPTFSTPV